MCEKATTVSYRAVGDCLPHRTILCRLRSLAVDKFSRLLVGQGEAKMGGRFGEFWSMLQLWGQITHQSIRLCQLDLFSVPMLYFTPFGGKFKKIRFSVEERQ